mgnify:CR=1 FL=1
MCDQVLKRITLPNFPAVGVSDDAGFYVGKTSIQYLNPFDFGFAPSTMKMSKDATVTAMGALQYGANEFGITGDFTNRRGLHIYLRRACGTTAAKGFDDWSHVQSIIRDDEDQYLQVDESAVSFDGSSITTLSIGQRQTFFPPFATNPQIYVFERSLTCRDPKAQWSIQQTLKQTDITAGKWKLISMSDDQTVLVIQFDTDNHFAIYTRQRAQKKTKYIADPSDGYVFKLLQNITATDLGVDSIGPISALSHDGKTLMIQVLDPALQVVQVEYDCEQKEYVKVSEFPIDATVDDLALIDMKFGGPCSERLFLLVTAENTQVRIHSRKPKNAASNCLLKTTLRPACCGRANFVNFSDETQVGKVESVLPTTLVPSTVYVHTLLTEAVNGDLFLIHSAIKEPNFPKVVVTPIPQTVSVRTFRQKPCVATNADEWCSCEVDEAIDFPESVYYKTNAYDMLSFDSDCQRFNYPVRQMMFPIQFPSLGIAYDAASLVYVSDPDGCFYLTRFDPFFLDPQNPQVYWYYYRVTGSNEPFVLGQTDAQFGEISNGVAYAGSLISINSKTCASKYLDVKVVDALANPVAPTPMQLLVDPSLVYQSLTIPMRLCFGVLSFNKSQ